MIRLLLGEGDRSVRRSLRHLLTEGVELVVVGVACTADEAIAKAGWLRPDVVLLDLNLREGSAVEACSAIHAGLPSVRLLVLGTYDDKVLQQSVLEAGADDYILKDLDLRPLQRAIQRVGHG